jgi:integrase
VNDTEAVASNSPHALRHRRVSLWFAHGVDQITIKTWAGHSRASMSSDKYGHVVIDAREDEWRDFWIAAYRRDRLPKRAPREDPVMTREDE